MSLQDDLALIGASIAVFTALVVVVRTAWVFLRKISHFIDDVSGEASRPGVPARPGLVEQVADLRIRQEEIGDVAQQAADDVSVVRLELTRNGGASTKDAAHQAARSAEAAAATAELAKQSADRVGELMIQHLEAGVEIMAIGVHNDAQLFAALNEHGIEVSDLRDYPAVDSGDV